MTLQPWTLATVPLAAVALATACGGTRAERSTTAATSTTTTAAAPATTAAPSQHAPALPPPPATSTTRLRVLAGQILTRLPTRRHVVALTFDAGAGAGGVPKILAALQQTGIPAMFFMTGRFAQLFPAWARRIAASYPIGNHTYDHPDLLKLSPPSRVSAEIVTAQRTIERVVRRPLARFFRFPYGSSNAKTLRVVNQAGYTAVGWTVDTLGWEGTSGGQSVQSVVSRTLAGLQPGEIVLMHVGSNPTDRSTLDANALKTIIRDIRARGYQLVALADLLRG
jgi:peptidoglycan/xylan/chitin deacetylase (PgdA/CDA1 family)